jgi:hypothetical protein
LEQREPSQAEVGTVLAFNEVSHVAALETTLKQKPPATTNMICYQSQQRVNGPAVWKKNVGQEKFQVEVVHGGNRKVVEF